MTPTQLQTLSTELKTDPLVRGYASMGDEDAAARVNVADRPFDGSVAAMLSYLLVNKNRTNNGTDTTTTSMLGRLIIIANAALASDPFGASIPVTLDLKCSALALLEVVRNPGITRLPYQTATLQQLLTDAITAGVMKAADRTAIIAMSNNNQAGDGAEHGGTMRRRVWGEHDDNNDSRGWRRRHANRGNGRCVW